MRIAAITPDRGDRPNFLERCKFYVDRQTQKVDHYIIDYPQNTFPIDLTERYMHGFNAVKDKYDVIFCIENDDWYSPRYVETMVRRWKEFGQPDVFGIGETYFCHFPSQSYWHREHLERACAYSTMISASAVDKINATSYNPLLFDMSLWRQFKGPTCQVNPPITIGMKHGFGVCGAAGHNEWFYNHDKTSLKDHNYKWLTAQIGEDDVEWYREMAKGRQA
jgi:hypothetical protein